MKPDDSILAPEQRVKHSQKCVCGDRYGHHAATTLACPLPRKERHAGRFHLTNVFKAAPMQTEFTADMVVSAESAMKIAVSPPHPNLGKVVTFGKDNKVGRVIEVVPNAATPLTTGLRNVADPRRDSAKLLRNHESYVIEQTNAPIGTARRDRIFWPRVSSIRF